MKVTLDHNRCQGHGRCYVLASTVFESDDDGYGFAISPDVPPGLEDDALKGVNNCPEDAIQIVDQ